MSMRQIIEAMKTMLSMRPRIANQILLNTKLPQPFYHPLQVLLGRGLQFQSGARSPNSLAPKFRHQVGSPLMRRKFLATVFQ